MREERGERRERRNSLGGEGPLPHPGLLSPVSSLLSRSLDPLVDRLPFLT
jgi:hypothetical protein